MRKFLKLFLLTATVAFAMSVMTMAADHDTETISEAITLDANSTYHNCTIVGSDSADAPLVITIPKEGITVSGKRMSYSADDDNGFRIQGNVKIIGEDGAVMYHENKESYATDAIIKIDKGASLTLEKVTLNGRKRDCDPDNPTVAERTWFGIYNDGTLNIEEGTVITGMVTKGTSYVFGCAILTNGTVNMNGGEITGNKQYDRAGYSIVMQSSDAAVNIKKGLIYDNQGFSIHQALGTLRMSGGLIMGQMSGSYKVEGDFRTGVVDDASKPILDAATAITDKNQQITIPLDTASKRNVYFTANPLHEIIVVSGGKEYMAVYGNNKWHFYEPEHAEHVVTLSEDKIYLSLSSDETKTAVIEGQVFCPNGPHAIDNWSCSPDGIVSLDYSENVNKCKITALKEGTATITAKTDDGAQDTCTVIVTPGNVINTNKTLDPYATYTDLILDGGSNEITITIPQGGITVASSDPSISCITVKGNVKIIGSNEIYHINAEDSGISSYAIIKVEKGGNLTIYDTKIYGASREKIAASGDADVDHSVVSTEENVKYGIYNEGVVTLYGYSSISRVHADDNVEEDGVIYNKGYFNIGTGANATIHNNYNCYAIYSDGGTETINGGAIIGQLPEGKTNITGNNATAGSVYGLAPGTNVIIGSLAGGSGELFNQKPVKIKANESIITSSKYYVEATVDGKTKRAKYNDGKWEFADSVEANISYVKQKDSSYASPFDSSHFNSEPNNNTGEENTIATAFYTTVANMAGKTHILCDVVIPANSTSYIKTTDEGKEHFELSAIDADGIKKAENPAEHTVRVAYAATGNNGDQFGLLINNFYSPSAKAYIIACTDAEYNAAVKDGYYTEATLASSGAEPAAISLD